MTRPMDMRHIPTINMDGGNGSAGLAGRGKRSWRCVSCINGYCCVLPRSPLTESAAASETHQYGDLAIAHPENDTYTRFAGIPEEVGIVYGVNGVCHQIANRLLYPTGRIVSRTPAYWFSVSTFGTYGTRVAPTGWMVSSGVASAVAMSVASDWQSRSRLGMGMAIADRGAPSGGLNGLAALISQIRALYADHQIAHGKAGQILSLELHAKELDLIFEYRLGSEIGPKKLKALRGLYREYLFQTPVREKTNSMGSFDPAAVAEAMNRLVNSFSAEVARLLGDDLFERLYGLPAHQEILLISPMILTDVDPLLEA